MSSLHFELNAHWLWLIVAALAITGMVWLYYYSHRSFLTTTQRVWLSVFRAFGLMLLILALFMPVIRTMTSYEDKPHVAVIVDNSASMGLIDGRTKRTEQTRHVLDALHRTLPDNAIVVVRAGQTVTLMEGFAIDSFKFDEQATNLEQPFSFLAQRRLDNIQAVILLSDGVYNLGANPLYAAQDFGKPVFTIGVGDTVLPKDVRLATLLVNPNAYRDVEMPIIVTLTADGVDATSSVVLLEEGREITRQTIRLKPEQRYYQVSLSYIPKESGLRKITAHIEPVHGEFSTMNNSRSEFVRVLPNERVIALIAGAPSPDVALIRGLLETDRSIRLRTFIQKHGIEFYGPAPTAADLRQAESIILVGFPHSTSPQSVIELVKDAVLNGKPLFFISSADIDPRKLTVLEPVLPFTVQRWSLAEMIVTGELTDRGAQHGIFQLEGSSSPRQVWDNLPPIFRPEAYVYPKPNAEVLSTIRIGTVPVSEPLIIARGTGSYRSVAFLGYGLYRWRTLGEGLEALHGRKRPALVQSLIMNSLRWLSADQSTQKVRIRTSKSHYTSGEMIEFIADIVDETLRPIDDATVQVTVGARQKQIQLILQPNGGGRYVSWLPGLARDDYSFTGRVVRGGTLYGSDNGRFTVGEIALEYQNLRMNAELLRALGHRTGGDFIAADSLDAMELWKRIEGLPTFQSRVVTAAQTHQIWNSWMLLSLAVVLLACEWYLRKRWGAV